MELNILSTDGQAQTISVSDHFNADFNEGLIHQVVVANLAAARAGTSAQKNRASVRGGGKKPWRQKGTGRARAGSIRSPIWRSGGVTFASSQRNYAQKVNKKMYRAALRSMLSELIRQDRLIIINELKLEQYKTKELIAKLKQLNVDNSVLIVTGEINMNLELAGRNIHSVGICQASEVGPLHLIQYEQVLMTADALRSIGERLV